MYYVYLVKCKDNTLYCGYTNELSRRIHEHNYSKKGAKYTKTRRPVKLVYAKAFLTKSEACKFEHQVKQLARSQKEELIKQIMRNTPQEY